MEKIKITPQEVIQEILPALHEFKSIKKRAKATYASVRASEQFDRLIKTYDKARIEVLQAHCKKDAEGNPVLENKNYTFENDEVKSKVEKEIETIAKMEHEIDIYGMEFSEIEDLELNDYILEALLKFKIVLAPGEKVTQLKPV